MVRERRWALPIALLSACWLLAWTVGTANAEENQRVLVLYEQGRSAAAVALADREIHEVLDKQTAHHVDLYIEYMNTDLIPEPGAQEKIRGLILAAKNIVTDSRDILLLPVRQRFSS